MRKLFLVFNLSVILLWNLAFSQTLNDYISAVKGDTLVVKDYYDIRSQPNSLYYVMFLDTIDVPAGRVYELKAN